MPKRTKRRRNIYDAVLGQGASLHCVLEDVVTTNRPISVRSRKSCRSTICCRARRVRYLATPIHGRKLRRPRHEVGIVRAAPGFGEALLRDEAESCSALGYHKRTIKMQLAILGIAENQLERAVKDIWAGLNAWRLWTLFGYNDVRMRYRRSTLGPFWSSLSMGVQVLVTGFVMAYLFNMTLQRYLPYICIGLIIWSFLTTVISEGATAFTSSAALIMQVKRPLFVYLLQIVWRNLIVGAHTIVVFFVVAFLFALFPGPTYLLAIPGLALFVLNCVWAAGVVAILSTRFRDIPLIVTNVFSVLFWLTPVLYEINQMSGRIRTLIAYNPLYHVVEVFRAPLLLTVPSTTNWLVAIGTAILGWLLLLLLFARTRKRIPFWL
jgi:lipopolysaccharide transport system permease protein